MGVKDAAELTDDASYHGARALLEPSSGKTINTFKISKKIPGAIDFATLAAPVANIPLKAARAVPGALAHGAREFMASAGQPAVNVVKPKGGNWLTGSASDVSARYRPLVQFRQDTLERMKLQDPEGYAEAMQQLQTDPDFHIRNWLDDKLTKYVQNDMATPGDPVRLAAEAWPEKKAALLAAKQAQIGKAVADMEKARLARGFTPEMMTRSQARIRQLEKEKALIEQKTGLHYDPRPVYADSPIDRRNKERRQLGGFPLEGMGTTDLSRRWEDMTDNIIEPRTVEDLLAGANKAPNWETITQVKNRVKEDPWLTKLEPSTIVNSVDGRFMNAEDPLGIEHLVDELRNMIRADSDLPDNLRLSTDKLGKMSVPQMVDRVSDVNAWRAVQAAEADLNLANNPATHLFKEYPEQGYKWVELKNPDFVPVDETTLPSRYELKYEKGSDGKELWGVVDKESKGVGDFPGDPATSKEKALENFNNWLKRSSSQHKDLEEALKYEGRTMSHCVGGYCPDVAEGRSRIFSLRDKDGKPRVTIEVSPSDTNALDRYFRQLPKSEQDRIFTAIYGDTSGFGKIVSGEELDAHARRVRDFLVNEKPELSELFDAQKIKQIKGFQNKAPDKEYLPFVHDFVKSQKWSEVRDLQNANLIRLDADSELARKMREAGQDVPDFLTQEELTDLAKKFVGYAKGGAVEASPFDELEPTFGQRMGAAVSDGLTGSMLWLYDKLADRDKLSSAHKIFLDSVVQDKKQPITNSDFKAATEK